MSTVTSPSDFIRGLMLDRKWTSGVFVVPSLSSMIKMLLDYILTLWKS